MLSGSQHKIFYDIIGTLERAFEKYTFEILYICSYCLYDNIMMNHIFNDDFHFPV